MEISVPQRLRVKITFTTDLIATVANRTLTPGQPFYRGHYEGIEEVIDFPMTADSLNLMLYDRDATVYQHYENGFDSFAYFPQALVGTPCLDCTDTVTTFRNVRNLSIDEICGFAPDMSLIIELEVTVELCDPELDLQLLRIAHPVSRMLLEILLDWDSTMLTDELNLNARLAEQCPEFAEIPIARVTGIYVAALFAYAVAH